MTFVRIDTLTSEAHFQNAIRRFIQSRRTPLVITDSSGERFYYHSRKSRHWKLDVDLKKIRKVIFDDIFFFMKKMAPRARGRSKTFIAKMILEYKFDPVKTVIKILIPAMKVALPMLLLAI